MTDLCELWPGGPGFRQSEHFPLGTDSVLLADFVSTASLRRGVDLGCGSGAIPLIILTRDPSAEMTGLEILPEAAEIARENMRVNGLSGRCGILARDLRQCAREFKTGSFDFAVSNPPYFPSGSGFLPADAGRAAARSEDSCTLEDLCRAAGYLVRSGGAFFLVHRPERLSGIFLAMTGRGIEPKRLRMVQHSAASAPNLVLIEGRRDGRPGLKIEPPLILTEGGTDSAEVRRIYHLGGDGT